MKKALPIIALAILTGCAKETPVAPPPSSSPGWSRQVPQPITPISGQNVQGNSVPFRWTSVADADDYMMDIRRLNAQGDTVFVYAWTTADTTRPVTTMNMPIGAPLMWRVRSNKAWAAPPTFSEWSEWATFVRLQ